MESLIFIVIIALITSQVYLFYKVTKIEASLTNKDSVDTRSEDDLYDEAKKIVIETQKASASLLQRKLSVGYSRAVRLLDILEKEGIVSPLNEDCFRKVLIGKDLTNKK